MTYTPSSGGGAKRPQTPPPSQFKHLGPSENRYTLLEHDEFWAVRWPGNNTQVWPGNTPQPPLLVTCVRMRKSARKIDDRQTEVPPSMVWYCDSDLLGSRSFLVVDIYAKNQTWRKRSNLNRNQLLKLQEATKSKLQFHAVDGSPLKKWDYEIRKIIHPTSPRILVEVRVPQQPMKWEFVTSLNN